MPPSPPPNDRIKDSITRLRQAQRREEMRKFEDDDYEDAIPITKGHKILLPKLNHTSSNMMKSDSMDNLNPWSSG
jgi:hypothetical protein